MQINSLLFLFLFLPWALVLTLASHIKLRNSILVILSLIFYAWGGVSITMVLIVSIICNYLLGMILQAIVNKRKLRAIIILSVTGNILLLVFYKYLAFLFTNINDLLAAFGSAPVVIKNVVIPAGISFFTFCNISYLIDIYRGDSKAEKNIMNFALYLSFFPRIIAGPIVRYKDTRDELTGRKISLESFSTGIERFIIGLGKKILIADNFAVVADKIFSLPASELTFYNAWIGVIIYALQLYIDFSGYSDMAIGLGKMLGFNIPENFNFPYIAKSVQEFWQRWHITLSTWLRDYLFTPLSIRFRNIRKAGIVFALLITFTLCGLWHNAGWNFIVWGLYMGVFLSIETLGFGRLLKKSWRPLQHLYLILIVLFGWVFFRSHDLAYAIDYCSAMLNFSEIPAVQNEFKILDNNMIIAGLIIAIAGSAGIFAVTGNLFKKWSSRLPLAIKGISILSYSVIEMAALFMIFVIAVSYIAINNYNPFIYFRF